MFKDRIKLINNKKIDLNGKYILYWMQSSTRTRYNHSLEYAIYLANVQKKDLLVFFNITPDFSESNYRHYKFSIEGLIDVKNNFLKRKISFKISFGDTIKNITSLARGASCIVCDKGYMKLQKKQRRDLIDNLHISIFQVESNLVVPIEVTSKKEEYAARTIRPKIKKNLKKYLYDFKKIEYEGKGIEEETGQVEFIDTFHILERLSLDRSVKDSNFIGGEVQALERLRYFIENNLESYEEDSSDPSKYKVSTLSPYLHFGHISPIEIAIEVEKKGVNDSSFIEELIVRRELAFNFVYYNDDYDKWKGITYEWAYKTLKDHEKDDRIGYTLRELENGDTHDIYWNSAMKEMRYKGFMHGYMRMYWCKKILHWSSTPEIAYTWTIYLNNKYFLDGRDPNSYAGVAWCFGKHDRAWNEREVFGKVRTMMESGLKRKFKIDKYVTYIESIISNSSKGGIYG